MLDDCSMLINVMFCVAGDIHKNFDALYTVTSPVGGTAG